MIYKEKQELTLTMFDVGQAESFLLKKGQETALIDCGTIAQGKDIVNKLKEQEIEKIDYIFITHPHQDHMGGMLDIISNFQIGKIILPNINRKKITAKWYKKIMNELDQGKYQLEVAEKNKQYNLDDVEIKTISGGTYKGKNINNYSTVLKVSYGQQSIIMTGDAEELVEKEILKSNQDIKATILKIGHHGSKTASIEEFINAIEPTYALISCGLNNKYNHPSEEVLERLDRKKIKTFRTDKMGNVILRITEQDVEISLQN